MVCGVMLNLFIAVFMAGLMLALCLDGNVAIIIGMALGAGWAVAERARHPH